jgi:hypothetical protein
MELAQESNCETILWLKSKLKQNFELKILNMSSSSLGKKVDLF